MLSVRTVYVLSSLQLPWLVALWGDQSWDVGIHAHRGPGGGTLQDHHQRGLAGECADRRGPGLGASLHQYDDRVDSADAHVHSGGDWAGGGFLRIRRGRLYHGTNTRGGWGANASRVAAGPGRVTKAC